jgi:hypothetical protein
MTGLSLSKFRDEIAIFLSDEFYCLIFSFVHYFSKILVFCTLHARNKIFRSGVTDLYIPHNISEFSPAIKYKEDKLKSSPLYTEYSDV